MEMDILAEMTFLFRRTALCASELINTAICWSMHKTDPEYGATKQLQPIYTYSVHGLARNPCTHQSYSTL